jgi:hypothetical protein
MRPSFDYERLEYPVIDNPTADQLLLLADIRSLEERIIRRRLWSAPSVRPLLQGAVQVAAAGAPDRARDAFNAALALFQKDVQTKNRLAYLTGALLGAGLLAVATASVLAAASLAGVTTLAKPSTVISLFVFAGLGSLASVFSRLQTIELQEETRRQWILVSAGTRPLLAVAFASVTYVILSRGLVTFNMGDPDGGKEAVIWVAAFLCGFSERFGTDLLGSLPFTKTATEPEPPVAQ